MRASLLASSRLCSTTMMFLHVASVLAAEHAPGAALTLRARWRAENNTFSADAALHQTLSGNALPRHCKLAVVGAGWGGAYVAWRMAIDTNTISADDVCVFEANGRVGGRVYSLHDLPFACVFCDQTLHSDTHTHARRRPTFQHFCTQLLMPLGQLRTTNE